jgi:hypothetical protein
MKCKMWCCCKELESGVYYHTDSMRESRSLSISAFVRYSDWTWRKWKSKGWKCIKVTIEITPIVKPIKKDVPNG